ncbi:hypothetical protein HOLleu_43571 [Holothuria leucospilota]|uniref:Uncharacterized protein n=1 Tax=Holothuria leucospilota TaxID=206669 RepID=A0A9Q0Y9H1_HOLLE|nr:hypothetical protein HOLleu_43571 [Holothuria leucospilota]
MRRPHNCYLVVRKANAGNNGGRFNVANDVCGLKIGSVEGKHRGWFDEIEEDIEKLIDKLQKAHKDRLDDKTSSKKKQDYQQVRQILQQELRKMNNDWWKKKAIKGATSRSRQLRHEDISWWPSHRLLIQGIWLKPSPIF